MPYPHPYPAGWYRFRYSHEVAAGQVVADRYFGKPLVCYRSRNGTAHVVDAYCAHLGAHLGDGQVHGDLLECPFHGWRYDGNGRCQHVPYADAVPPRAAIRSYPVVERCGVIYFHHDTTGAAPDFDIPDLPELKSSEWMRRTVFTRTIRSHIQEPRENALDVAHTPVLHRSTFATDTVGLPTIAHWNEDAARRQLSFDFLVSIGGEEKRFESVFTFCFVGPGHVVMRRSFPIPVVFVVPLTPVDDQHIVFSYAIWVKKTRFLPYAYFIERMIARHFEKGLLEDFRVFEKKTYHEQPALSSADGPILQFRRWMSQFYPPGGAGGSSTSVHWDQR